MPIDWTAATGLVSGELQQLLIDEAERIMAGPEGADQDAQFARLEEPLQVIWLLSWLDFEVAQGSLEAYFFNSHGRFAVLAAEALAKIGAHRMHDVLAAAELTHATDADDLRMLTESYWEAADLDDWGDRLDAYLARQVAELARGSR